MVDKNRRNYDLPPLTEISTEKFNAQLATNLTSVMMAAREPANNLADKPK